MRFGPLLVVAGLAAPHLAWADEPVLALDEGADDHVITVVATGQPSRISESGQAITVIAEDEIASLQDPDLTRVLERAPGLTISRNGGVGGFTGVRVRGSASEQVLVLVDGVRAADVAAPGGGFDFGTVTSGEIGRIELLRGSNSVVWGSDALGGVLALSTREPAGLEASAEYGARDSFAAQAGWGAATPGYVIRFGAGFAHGDGVSAAAGGSEPDGFRQWNAHANGEVPLGEALSLVATVRYADGRVQIDGFPPPFFGFADTAEIQDTRQASGRAGLRWERGALRLDAGYAHSDTHRDLVDPAIGPDAYFTTKGVSGRVEAFGRWSFAPAWTLDFGADRQRDRFVTGPTFGSRGRATLASGHALVGWHGARADLAGGVRYDRHSRFGGEWTLGANGSVKLGGNGWRARASYGEGFKAPTLFQLLSDFGNPTLDPERSRSYDLGLERSVRGDRLHVALTAFRRDSRDLIDFVSCFGSTAAICAGRPFGTYDNVGRARAEGVELELGARPDERLQVQAAYSYIRARSRDTGLDLARRPRHALTLAADWRSPWQGLALGGDLRLVSDSFDDAGNLARLDGFALITLRVSVPLHDAVELYGRIENLGDVRYQTAAGYGSAGRSGYVGVRVRL